jgi:bacterioferritin (cytochrome b1)
LLPYVFLEFHNRFGDVHLSTTNDDRTMHLADGAPEVNGAGQTEYGGNVVEALKQEEQIEQSSVQKLSKEQDLVLKTFRLLIADLCQQFKGGHPGYVLQPNTIDAGPD